jgi:hypothetical protein
MVEHDPSAAGLQVLPEEIASYVATHGVWPNNVVSTTRVPHIIAFETKRRMAFNANRDAAKIKAADLSETAIVEDWHRHLVTTMLPAGRC